MQLSPLAGALGAEIHGVDLRKGADWNDIHKAFLQYAVSFLFVLAVVIIIHELGH